MIHGIPIVIHPPVDSRYRAHCAQMGGKFTELSPKPYLKRNHDIVDACDALIVLPKDPEKKELRSGTWATYRYALKSPHKRILLF